MSTLAPIPDPESNPRVKAVFDDIRATRKTDFVNNLWRTLAFDPALLERTWAEVKALMASPTQLDPLTKEMIYIAVSIANACGYCVHSHTAAARAKGMTDAQHAELLAIVALAALVGFSRIAVGAHWPVDVLAGALIGVAGGWLAGRLIGRGWSVNAARKVALLLCALAVVPVFLAPFAPTVWLAVLIVGLAGSAHQGWSANLYSVVSDTMPRDVISSVIGLGGFVAYFTGGFVNGFTGMILQKTGSYVTVFAYFSGMYLLSLLAVQLLVPRLEPERKG